MYGFKKLDDSILSHATVNVAIEYCVSYYSKQYTRYTSKKRIGRIHKYSETIRQQKKRQTPGRPHARKCLHSEG